MFIYFLVVPALLLVSILSKVRLAGLLVHWHPSCVREAMRVSFCILIIWTEKQQRKHCTHNKPPSRRPSSTKLGTARSRVDCNISMISTFSPLSSVRGDRSIRSRWNEANRCKIASSNESLSRNVAVYPCSRYIFAVADLSFSLNAIMILATVSRSLVESLPTNP